MASRAGSFTSPTEMSTGGKMRPLSEVLCQAELGPAAGECGTDPKENKERRRMNSGRQWPAGYGATEGMAGFGRRWPVGCGRSGQGRRS